MSWPPPLTPELLKNPQGLLPTGRWSMFLVPDHPRALASPRMLASPHMSASPQMLASHRMPASLRVPASTSMKPQMSVTTIPAVVMARRRILARLKKGKATATTVTAITVTVKNRITIGNRLNRRFPSHSRISQSTLRRWPLMTTRIPDPPATSHLPIRPMTGRATPTSLALPS